jgi:hypothetical protein
MMAPDEVFDGECRRQFVERRQANFRSMLYALIRARRKNDRRFASSTSIYYSDNYGPYVTGGAVLLMLLCILDAYFTLMLLPYGSTELNPILAWALEQHVLLFFLIKYTVTAVSVVFTVVHKHFKVLGINGHHFLLGYLVGYAVLIQYQVSMLMRLL